LKSLDVPPKTLEAFTKIFQAFLWKGRHEVNGGHCLVVWDEVTTPKCFGGWVYPIFASSTLCSNAGGRGFNGRTLPRHGPNLIFSFLVSRWPSLRRPWWFSWSTATELGSGVTVGWTIPG
jgi:hypothetical protein